MRRVLALGQLLTVLFSALPAFAHPFHPEHTGGFSHALLHPLTGLDHLLAALALGLVAERFGGRTRVLLPILFLATMALGALGAGVSGSMATEAGILSSLFVLAVVLVLPQQGFGATILAAAAGAFGLFHGFAHGSELGAAGSEIFGTVIGSAFLVAGGIFCARAVSQQLRPRLFRGAAAVCACAGLLLPTL